MSFIWPEMLGLLVLLPVAIVGYIRLTRRRRARVAALAARGFAPSSSARTHSRARHVPAALFLAALAMMIVALARPQLRVGLPHREGVVVLAFDVSNSMQAADLQPTRLDAAKAAAKAFVEAQPSSIKIGLVAFNNGALITQQPTTDHADAEAAIDRLKTAGATSLGHGIFAALTAIAGKPIPLPDDPSLDDLDKVDIGYYGSAAIVLLSDGENTAGPDATAIAQLASTAGVHIYSIGVGSPDGTVLSIDGFNVATALDEQTLTKIASVTNGSYHNATDSATLTQVYKNLDLRTVIDPEKTETTALFAGVGVLLLIIGGIVSMLRFGRLI
ncbi:MAG TPA: VWA domain-containing protein [Ilumatobacteraceae bacterium]|nr:VWA domain-containing protein [Ilumatobacteraceae bacterium]